MVEMDDMYIYGSMYSMQVCILMILCIYIWYVAIYNSMYVMNVCTYVGMYLFQIFIVGGYIPSQVNDDTDISGNIKNPGGGGWWLQGQNN